MDAKEKINEQLERLFADAPKSRAAWELQEELLANCMERYNDLVDKGMNEDEALNNVMSNIGNVDELIDALPGNDPVTVTVMDDERRRRSATTVTVAVGLYILALVLLLAGIFLSQFYTPIFFIALIGAVLLCIVPTCMLVYNAYRWPSYKKRDDTVVEDFKRWNNDEKKMKGVRGALSSVLWTLAVVIYLAVSFATFAWYITWIIFIVAACLEAVITLVFKLKEIG